MSVEEDRDDDLRDERLRLALAHAPDHTAAPNWRLRKSILQSAHDAVGISIAPWVPERDPRAWWQRLLGLGGGSSRMPWNAAFATVLVAVLVTVLWQREPVPGARPDSEAPVAAQAPKAQVPAAPPAPSAAPQPSEPAPAATPAPAPAPAPIAEAPAVPDAAPVPPAPPSPSPPAERRQADEARKKESRPTQSAPVVPATPESAASPAPAAPAPAPAPSQPPAKATPGPEPRDTLAARSRSEADAASRQNFTPPPSPPAGLIAPGGDAAGAARLARPAAAPSVRTESTAPPTFSALSQWSRITITQRGGASRNLARAEALDLNALLGSAAISAVGGQALAGAAEWRVTFERNGEVLATMEVGRNQVRWREGGTLPGTGAPSAGTLAALKDALGSAVQPPVQPPPPEAEPAAPAR